MSQVDYASLTKLKVSQLKQELSKVGLSTTGRKATLVNRYGNYLVQQSSNSGNSNSNENNHNSGSPSSSEQNDLKKEIDTLRMEIQVLKMRKQVEELKSSSSSNEQSSLSENIAKAVKYTFDMSRTVIPEPPVFSGNPILYKEWETSFDALIDEKQISANEKIFYLKKYLTGKAKECVNGYFLLPSETAYNKARSVLRSRFGDDHVVADAFQNKLASWPKIAAKDVDELEKFSDFVNQCSVAMSYLPGLASLNNCGEMRKLLCILPEWVVSRWNQLATDNKITYGCYPDFSKFAEFLLRQSTMATDPLTSLHAVRTMSAKSKVTTDKQDKPKSVSFNTSSSPPESCVFCKLSSHPFSECRKFARKKFHERRAFVQNLKLCFGCLKEGHMSSDCNNRLSCKMCSGSHPTCFHIVPKNHSSSNPTVPSASVSPDPTPNESSSPAAPVSPSSFCSSIKSATNIMTSMIVPVYVSDPADPSNELLTYAMIDTQSNTSFISDDLADNFPGGKSVNLSISTMTSNHETIKARKLTNLKIRGIYKSIEDALVVPEVYSRVNIPVDKSHIPTPQTANTWSHLRDIAYEIAPLQDCRVGLLVGYNCSDASAPRQVITGSIGEPYGVLTDLGWSIVGGSSLCNPEVSVTHRLIAKEAIDNAKILQCLEGKFQSHDNSSDKMTSQNDLVFLDVMHNNIKLENGHYSMPLPLISEQKFWPDNRSYILKRFMTLEKRLKCDAVFKQKYFDFMNAIIENGEAELIPKHLVESRPRWYIPHHGVFQTTKPDKLRVVFDCSATYKGHSLNEELLQGPDLNNNLVGIICRFRKQHVAVICDIQKMYHQFFVHKEHRDYLRFLWYHDNEIADFHMNVHVFGAKSSPSCACYGLKQLARDHVHCFPESSAFLQSNFYVDDGLVSLPSSSEAIKLLKDTILVCSKGGLKLHKFVSNSPKVLHALGVDSVQDNPATNSFMESARPMQKALGILWETNKDIFCFQSPSTERPLTRRGILAVIASIFDPLGLIAPFVLVGRLLLQVMCKSNSSWDSPLDQSLKQQWEHWYHQLFELSSLEFPRCLMPLDFSEILKTELHVFCDASFSGYGACAYLRLFDTKNRVSCNLLMSKARVAPRKVLTVPRLELLAAVLGVDIGYFLKEELSYQRLDIFYWSDSKVVLSYIANDARKFHTFVSNRIQKIRDKSHPDNWHYIPGNLNPSDLASRGALVSQLSNMNWLCGPEFLRLGHLYNENSEFEIPVGDPEVRALCLSTAVVPSSILDRLERFSDWQRLIKTVVHLKSLARSYSSHSLVRSNVTNKEATLWVVQLLQQNAFQEEIADLLAGKPLNKRSVLHRLDPFIDSNQILRVGGRLKHSLLSNAIKHPVILPKCSPLVQVLIRHFHQAVAHQGRNTTLNKLRTEGFYVIGGTKFVSSVIHHCNICKRLRGNTCEQKMADLPPERVEASPPFSYVGFDVFGPFYVKDYRKEIKRYALIFTCFSSRAVHIEQLDDLSTDSFINSLRCFLAIRGPVVQLQSDRGCNFVGASNELRKGLQSMSLDKIATFLKLQQCEFKFNTPSSSHMGGVWERQIRTARNILKGLLCVKPFSLDTSSLRALFYEVTSIINSRPLTAVSSNVSDPLPISPNQLLTMKTANVLPPPGNFDNADIYSKKRWRRVQYIAENFWSRWRNEFLSSLQSRSKWHNKHPNIDKGDIVLLKDQNLIRNQWQLGRVEEVFCGPDGLVRSVRLRLGDASINEKGKRVHKPIFLERPIVKIVLLEKRNSCTVCSH